MTGSVLLALGAAGGVPTLADGPELPTIDDFLLPEILFEGTPFAMNRVILDRVIMTVVMLIVLGVTAAHATTIPTKTTKDGKVKVKRWQLFIEFILEFVQNNIVYTIMGEKRGRRYLPIITTIFFTVMCFNLCGVIPGMNMAATATIAMPLMLALYTLVQYWRTGIRENGGLGRYLKKELFPPGIPWPVYILLSPIELLEICIVQPASLTIRLFANMVSGHLTLATCLVMTDYYMIEMGKASMIPAGFGWLVFGIVMTCFEIFIAVLQAFIFSILSTVYINNTYPEDE